MVLFDPLPIEAWCWWTSFDNSKEEPPIEDEIQPIETFVESKGATNFEGFEVLHNTTLNIDDQFLCYNVQMEAR